MDDADCRNVTMCSKCFTYKIQYGKHFNHNLLLILLFIHLFIFFTIKLHSCVHALLFFLQGHLLTTGPAFILNPLIQTDRNAAEFKHQLDFPSPHAL